MRADHVHLYPPADDPIGEFRYRERYGPLRTMRQLVSKRLAPPQHPGLQALSVGDNEPLITVEGEYACLVRISATMNRRPARRVITAVFTSAFTTLLDGISVMPDRFDEFEALARELTRHTRLLLGIRRRRFVYAPPSGWHAIANVLTTNWYPPDYPGNHARLIAFPASPRNKPPERILAMHMEAERQAGVVIDAVTGPETATSRHGLTGVRWYIDTRSPAFERMLQVLAVFEDNRYTYPLRLDLANTASAAHAEDARVGVFDRVCDSVEPIPGSRADAVGDAFDFWAS